MIYPDCKRVILHGKETLHMTLRLLISGFQNREMTWVAQGNHVISQQQRIDWRFAEEEGRRESQRDSKHLIDALPLVVNMGGARNLSSTT